MAEAVLNRMPWAKDNPSALPRLLTREWLVTNGLGGYAAGTVAGACTRRFHGLLIAALPAPLGRMMMLNHVAEEARLSEAGLVRLGGEETEEGGTPELPGTRVLSEFRLESGLPVWRFELGGVVLEKSVVMPHMQNTVFVRYRVLSGPKSIRLHMRPSLHFRPHEGRVDEALSRPYSVLCRGERYEIQGEAGLPPLKLLAYGRRSSFVLDGGRFQGIFYRVEQGRGYDARGSLWSPGYLRADLGPGEDATLAASTEAWEIFAAMRPEEAFSIELERRERLLKQSDPRARSGSAAELVLAADQFVTTPNMRVVPAARARAEGDDVRTIVAGYHWFTDWGRDAMISLEGLTLATGRRSEAGHVLRLFARHVRDGLIPNLFPERESSGLYHTADATLWFFHALDRYLEWTKDRGTLKLLLPTLTGIVERHLAGTRFGIAVDRSDGLLRQGQEGAQLTWMDAKVGDWVVTPRRGKAVEINALWYNALRLLERWSAEENEGTSARRWGKAADRARESFNRRFWNPRAGCLYDVLDGDEGEKAKVRPNQIIALSLPHPVLEEGCWRPVLETVHRELLTPVGLRSLAPSDPDYHPRYDGDLRARDAAYHQGTVWAWLIGPFIDAWLRVHPDDRAGARRFLAGFEAHLGEACLGSISEIFDAEEPFTPRGCVAQAWSVAEALRAWVKTAP